jgi:hypothetical protein
MLGRQPQRAHHQPVLQQADRDIGERFGRGVDRRARRRLARQRGRGQRAAQQTGHPPWWRCRPQTHRRPVRRHPGPGSPHAAHPTGCRAPGSCRQKTRQTACAAGSQHGGCCSTCRPRATPSSPWPGQAGDEQHRIQPQARWPSPARRPAPAGPACPWPAHALRRHGLGRGDRVASRPARLHPWLHPEDAELRVRDRRIQRGTQAQRQHAARVGRVDDTVVPQAGGGEIRMALLLVLAPDRRLEGLFVLDAPLSPRASMPSRRTVASTARPGRRPSPRCAHSATSTGNGANTRGRTCRSCRRRNCRR